MCAKAESRASASAARSARRRFRTCRPSRKRACRAIVATTWLGVVAPAKTPRDIVDKLNKAVNEALKSPPVVAQFKLTGDEAVGGTPEDYARLIKSDNAKWKDVVARSGARLE